MLAALRSEGSSVHHRGAASSSHRPPRGPDDHADTDMLGAAPHAVDRTVEQPQRSDLLADATVVQSPTVPADVAARPSVAAPTPSSHQYHQTSPVLGDLSRYDNVDGSGGIHAGSSPSTAATDGVTAATFASPTLAVAPVDKTVAQPGSAADQRDGLVAAGADVFEGMADGDQGQGHAQGPQHEQDADDDGYGVQSPRRQYQVIRVSQSTVKSKPKRSQSISSQHYHASSSFGDFSLSQRATWAGGAAASNSSISNSAHNNSSTMAAGLTHKKRKKTTLLDFSDDEDSEDAPDADRGLADAAAQSHHASQRDDASVAPAAIAGANGSKDDRPLGDDGDGNGRAHLPAATDGATGDGQHGFDQHVGDENGDDQDDEDDDVIVLDAEDDIEDDDAEEGDEEADGNGDDDDDDDQSADFGDDDESSDHVDDATPASSLERLRRSSDHHTADAAANSSARKTRSNKARRVIDDDDDDAGSESKAPGAGSGTGAALINLLDDDDDDDNIDDYDNRGNHDDNRDGDDIEEFDDDDDEENDDDDDPTDEIDIGALKRHQKQHQPSLPKQNIASQSASKRRKSAGADFEFDASEFASSSSAGATNYRDAPLDLIDLMGDDEEDDVVQLGSSSHRAAGAAASSSSASSSAAAASYQGPSLDGFPDPLLPFYRPVRLIEQARQSQRDVIHVDYSGQFKGACGPVAREPLPTALGYSQLYRVTGKKGGAQSSSELRTQEQSRQSVLEDRKRERAREGKQTGVVRRGGKGGKAGKGKGRGRQAAAAAGGGGGGGGGDGGGGYNGGGAGVGGSAPWARALPLGIGVVDENGRKIRKPREPRARKGRGSNTDVAGHVANHGSSGGGGGGIRAMPMPQSRPPVALPPSSIHGGAYNSSGTTGPPAPRGIDNRPAWMAAGTGAGAMSSSSAAAASEASNGGWTSARPVQAQPTGSSRALQLAAAGGGGVRSAASVGTGGIRAMAPPTQRPPIGSAAGGGATSGAGAAAKQTSSKPRSLLEGVPVFSRQQAAAAAASDPYRNFERLMDAAKPVVSAGWADVGYMDAAPGGEATGRPDEDAGSGLMFGRARPGPSAGRFDAMAALGDEERIGASVRR